MGCFSWWFLSGFSSGFYFLCGNIVVFIWSLRVVEQHHERFDVDQFDSIVIQVLERRNMLKSKMSKTFMLF